MKFWRKVGFWVIFRTIYGFVGVFFWLSPNIFRVSKAFMAQGFDLPSVEVVRGNEVYFFKAINKYYRSKIPNWILCETSILIISNLGANFSFNKAKVFFDRLSEVTK